MATSFVELKDLGRIKVFRRRGLKNIRLSIDPSGEVRLSIPWYVPKAAGLRYARSKKEWIKKHRQTIKVYQPMSARAKKLLKTEAEKKLVPLLMQLAERSNFEVKDVRIKNLKSRWGSCNQDKVITLNQFLINLPDKLVEYVIVHELAHTKHLNHSKQFWQTVEEILPNYKTSKKQLRAYNTMGLF